MSPGRWVAVVAVLGALAVPTVTPAAAGVAHRSSAPSATGGPDRLRASDAVPPGESGNTTLAQFTAVTGGASSSYGPHTDDQEALYAGFRDKSMQFQNGPGTAVPGDAAAKIWRNSYGVPTITAPSESDAYFAVGYAMAQDRLFQMEVFRHVGHGTLASLIGASGIAMDKSVQRYSEGSAELMKEFHTLPKSYQLRVQRFTAGVNERINEVQGSQASQLPAEFTLLGDLPIKAWSVSDTLGFGEYAARFFGEFGHGELQNAATYLHLVKRYGRRRGMRIFNDLVPLNDRHAPTTIAKADGVFPRHTAKAVHVAHPYAGSRFVNDNPAMYGGAKQVAKQAQVANRAALQLTKLQRLLAIPRMGSNAIAVSGRLTESGHPMLYAGPQTGWASPGFFWEVEINDPQRHQRGVMLPGIPLFLIGRNSDAAWTVTSGLDANSETFQMTVNKANTKYRYDGKWRALRVEHQTITCNTPPSNATSILSGQLPTTCPSKPVTQIVYGTVLGPSISGPDASHHLYVRDAAEDGHLISSIAAWDKAGQSHTAAQMSHALKHLSLGFNFVFVDDRGQIGYWHVGRYPLRPANIDPRLPIPGNGRFNSGGVEPFRTEPHVVDPSTGYIANWNNKPAVGWPSPNLQISTDEGGIWGDYWELVPLRDALKARLPVTYSTLRQVPKAAAYVDDQARVFKPYLLRALAGTNNARLRTIRKALVHWDDRRDEVNAKGDYSTPAIPYFDRFVVRLLADAAQPTLGSRFSINAGLFCTVSHPTCEFHSLDNEAAPTYKFEYPVEETVLAALRGQTRWPWLRSAGGRTKLFRTAARQTLTDLTKTQGRDIAKWTAPAEQAVFSSQGAVSVPPITPLPNKGSFTMLVEATGSPVARPHGQR